MTSATQDPTSSDFNRFANAPSEGGQAVDKASDAASKFVDSAKAQASEFASNAADSFKSAVEDQKTAGAGPVGAVGRGATGAADTFQDRPPEPATAVRSVANRVERLSNDMRDRSVDDLMASVTQF